VQKKNLCFLGLFIIFAGFSCSSPPSAVQHQQTTTISQPQQPATQSQTASQFWIGDGGRGKSIAILAPNATGLTANQEHLAALVQGEFVSNFSSYTALSVLDRQSLEEQYAELLSGLYDDDSLELWDLGRLPPTTYLLSGNIIRTATEYVLQIRVTRNSDKMTVAYHSETFTFEELDNLTGVRRASLDLLQKMGITPTERTRVELSRTPTRSHVNAQTALAQGITAQRRGTQVAALNYYFQATTFDPTLLEAETRASILSRNINSGNVREDARADIAWRRDWIDQLTETEQHFSNFFRTFNQPYALIYSTDLNYGQVDYITETIPISFVVSFREYANWINIVEKTVQTMLDGLNQTGRKEAWGIGNWPQRNVSNINPFQNGSKDFNVSVELVNNDESVIGRQTFTVRGSWAFDFRSGFRMSSSTINDQIITFSNVNVNYITDVLTIRFLTVNGVEVTSAEINNALLITTRTDYRDINGFDFDGYNQNGFDRDGFNRQGFNRAGRDKNGFTRAELNRFTLVNGTITRYTGPGGIVKIPPSINGMPVNRIGAHSFLSRDITGVEIPDSVRDIDNDAFHYALTYISIGSNVNISFIPPNHPYTRNLQLFVNFYRSNSRQAGVYNWRGTAWSFQRQN
jgi:TolB-like protein